MVNALFTRTVKSGKITYFIDVKEAKNNTKYLTVTASQPSTNGDKKFAKRSIIIFNTAAEEMQQALHEALDQIK